MATLFNSTQGKNRGGKILSLKVARASRSISSLSFQADHLKLSTEARKDWMKKKNRELIKAMLHILAYQNHAAFIQR
jgi:hypothetical protein